MHSNELKKGISTKKESTSKPNLGMEVDSLLVIILTEQIFSDKQWRIIRFLKSLGLA